MRMARRFFEFTPQLATVTSTKDIGYLVFQDQNQLNQFLESVAGWRLPSGEELEIQPAPAYIGQKMNREEELRRESIRSRSEEKRMKLEAHENSKCIESDESLIDIASLFS